MAVEDTLKARRLKQFKKLILWPLLGATGLAIIFDWRDIQQEGLIQMFDTLGISFLFWTILANGNDWLICQLDKRWSWVEEPVKRGIISVLAIFSLTLILSLIVITAYVYLFYGYNVVELAERGLLPGLLVTPLTITAFVTLIGHGQSFLLSWREAAINVERLKTENMKSRFESLRNQVNPHFLFNSLNALSSLVYSDQAKAEKFIHKLSDVYRFLLEYQNEETIPLESELEFLDAFIYLNKIRFGRNLEIDVDIPRELASKWEVPPIVSQMLVENCLKHNEISNDRKLRISVSVAGDSLIVENNVNPLHAQKEISSGVGLDNIKARYKMLTDRPVKIEQSESTFKVTIPLLQVN